MMRLELLTAPTTLAVDVLTVKEHIRVADFGDDYLIGQYVKSATAYLDGWNGILGMALMPQEWTATLSEFPAGCISIPLGPVTGITSVTYKDDAGVVQTMAPSEYEVSVSSSGASIKPTDSWPSTGDYLDPVSVAFSAGAGCPMPIQMAIMMMVSGIYDGREGDDMLTPAVRALIAPHRRPRF